MANTDMFGNIVETLLTPNLGGVVPAVVDPLGLSRLIAPELPNLSALKGSAPEEYNKINVKGVGNFASEGLSTEAIFGLAPMPTPYGPRLEAANKDHLVRKGLNLNEYTPYLGENIYMGQDLDHLRAKNQSVLEQVGRTIINPIGGIPAGIIENVGYLAALATEWGDDRDYKNWITELGQNMRKGWRENVGGEVFRLDPGKVWDMNDSAWWLGHAEGLVESIGEFAVTGAGVGKLLGAGARGLANTLTKSAKAARGFEMAAHVGTSATLAYTEGAMSGAEVYKKIYAEQLEKTKDPEVAKHRAATAAATTVQLNTLVNTFLNIGSVAPMFKSTSFLGATSSKHLSDKAQRALDAAINKTGKVAGKTTGELAEEAAKRIGNIDTGKLKSTWKDWSVGAVSEMGQEGVEEMVNLWAEKSGERVGRLDAKTFAETEASIYNSTIAQLGQVLNFGDDTLNEEGLLNFVLGAFGGIGQKSFMDHAPITKTEERDGDGNIRMVDGKPVMVRMSGEAIKKRNEGLAIDRIKRDLVSDLNDFKQRSDSLAILVKEATENPSPELQEAIEIKKQELLNFEAFRSIKNGNGEYLKSTFRNIANLDNTTSLGDLDQYKAQLATLDKTITEETAKPEAEQDKDALADTTAKRDALKKAMDNPALTQAIYEGYAEKIGTTTHVDLANKSIKQIDEYTKEYESIMSRYNYGDGETSGLAKQLWELKINSKNAEQRIESIKKSIESAKESDKKKFLNDSYRNALVEAAAIGAKIKAIEDSYSPEVLASQQAEATSKLARDSAEFLSLKADLINKYPGLAKSLRAEGKTEEQVEDALITKLGEDTKKIGIEKLKEIDKLKAEKRALLEEYMRGPEGQPAPPGVTPSADDVAKALERAEEQLADLAKQIEDAYYGHEMSIIRSENLNKIVKEQYEIMASSKGRKAFIANSAKVFKKIQEAEVELKKNQAEADAEELKKKEEAEAKRKKKEEEDRIQKEKDDKIKAIETKRDAEILKEGRAIIEPILEAIFDENITTLSTINLLTSILKYKDHLSTILTKDELKALAELQTALQDKGYSFTSYLGNVVTDTTYVREVESSMVAELKDEGTIIIEALLPLIQKELSQDEINEIIKNTENLGPDETWENAEGFSFRKGMFDATSAPGNYNLQEGVVKTVRGTNTTNMAIPFAKWKNSPLDTTLDIIYDKAQAEIDLIEGKAVDDSLKTIEIKDPKVLKKEQATLKDSLATLKSQVVVLKDTMKNMNKGRDQEQLDRLGTALTTFADQRKTAATPEEASKAVLSMANLIAKVEALLAKNSALTVPKGYEAIKKGLTDSGYSFGPGIGTEYTEVLGTTATEVQDDTLKTGEKVVSKVMATGVNKTYTQEEIDKFVTTTDANGVVTYTSPVTGVVFDTLPVAGALTVIRAGQVDVLVGTNDQGKTAKEHIKKENEALPASNKLITDTIERTEKRIKEEEARLAVVEKLLRAIKAKREANAVEFKESQAVLEREEIRKLLAHVITPAFSIDNLGLPYSDNDPDVIAIKEVFGTNKELLGVEIVLGLKDKLAKGEITEDTYKELEAHFTSIDIKNLLDTDEENSNLLSEYYSVLSALSKLEHRVRLRMVDKLAGNAPGAFNPSTNEILLSKDIFNAPNLSREVFTTLLAHESIHAFVGNSLEALSKDFKPELVADLTALLSSMAGGSMSVSESLSTIISNIEATIADNEANGVPEGNAVLKYVVKKFKSILASGMSQAGENLALEEFITHALSDGVFASYLSSIPSDSEATTSESVWSSLVNILVGLYKLVVGANKLQELKNILDTHMGNVIGGSPTTENYVIQKGFYILPDGTKFRISDAGTNNQVSVVLENGSHLTLSYEEFELSFKGRTLNEDDMVESYKDTMDMVASNEKELENLLSNLPDSLSFASKRELTQYVAFLKKNITDNDSDENADKFIEEIGKAVIAEKVVELVIRARQEVTSEKSLDRIKEAVAKRLGELGSEVTSFEGLKFMNVFDRNDEFFHDLQRVFLDVFVAFNRKKGKEIDGLATREDIQKFLAITKDQFFKLRADFLATIEAKREAFEKELKNGTHTEEEIRERVAIAERGYSTFLNHVNNLKANIDNMAYARLSELGDKEFIQVLYSPDDAHNFVDGLYMVLSEEDGNLTIAPYTGSLDPIKNEDIRVIPLERAYRFQKGLKNDSEWNREMIFDIMSGGFFGSTTGIIDLLPENLKVGGKDSEELIINFLKLVVDTETAAALDPTPSNQRKASILRREFVNLFPYEKKDPTSARSAALTAVREIHKKVKEATNKDTIRKAMHNYAESEGPKILSALTTNRKKIANKALFTSFLHTLPADTIAKLAAFKSKTRLFLTKSIAINKNKQLRTKLIRNKLDVKERLAKGDLLATPSQIAELEHRDIIAISRWEDLDTAYEFDVNSTFHYMMDMQNPDAYVKIGKGFGKVEVYHPGIILNLYNIALANGDQAKATELFNEFNTLYQVPGKQKLSAAEFIEMGEKFNELSRIRKAIVKLYTDNGSTDMRLSGEALGQIVDFSFTGGSLDLESGNGQPLSKVNTDMLMAHGDQIIVVDTYLEKTGNEVINTPLVDIMGQSLPVELHGVVIPRRQGRYFVFAKDSTGAIRPIAIKPIAASENDVFEAVERLKAVEKRNEAKMASFESSKPERHAYEMDMTAALNSALFIAVSAAFGSKVKTELKLFFNKGVPVLKLKVDYVDKSGVDKTVSREFKYGTEDELRSSIFAMFGSAANLRKSISPESIAKINKSKQGDINTYILDSFESPVGYNVFKNAKMRISLKETAKDATIDDLVYSMANNTPLVPRSDAQRLAIEANENEFDATYNKGVPKVYSPAALLETLKGSLLEPIRDTFSGKITLEEFNALKVFNREFKTIEELEVAVAKALDTQRALTITFTQDPTVPVPAYLLALSINSLEDFIGVFSRRGIRIVTDGDLVSDTLKKSKFAVLSEVEKAYEVWSTAKKLLKTPEEVNEEEFDEHVVDLEYGDVDSYLEAAIAAPYSLLQNPTVLKVLKGELGFKALNKHPTLSGVKTRAELKLRIIEDFLETKTRLLSIQGTLSESDLDMFLDSGIPIMNLFGHYGIRVVRDENLVSEETKENGYVTFEQIQEIEKQIEKAGEVEEKSISGERYLALKKSQKVLVEDRNKNKEILEVKIKHKDGTRTFITREGNKRLSLEEFNNEYNYLERELKEELPDLEELLQKKGEAELEAKKLAAKGAGPAKKKRVVKPKPIIEKPIIEKPVDDEAPVEKPTVEEEAPIEEETIVERPSLRIVDVFEKAVLDTWIKNADSHTPIEEISDEDYDVLDEIISMHNKIKTDVNSGGVETTEFRDTYLAMVNKIKSEELKNVLYPPGANKNSSFLSKGASNISSDLYNQIALDLFTRGVVPLTVSPAVLSLHVREEVKSLIKERNILIKDREFRSEVYTAYDSNPVLKEIGSGENYIKYAAEVALGLKPKQSGEGISSVIEGHAIGSQQDLINFLKFSSESNKIKEVVSIEDRIEGCPS